MKQYLSEEQNGYLQSGRYEWVDCNIVTVIWNNTFSLWWLFNNISFLNVFLDYVSMLWGESCWTFFSDPSDRSADYMESLQWSFQMSINLPLPYFMSPLVLVVVYLMKGPTWLTPYGYNKTVIIISCFRASLHGGGRPQVGEVSCGGSPRLTCKRDHINRP